MGPAKILVVNPRIDPTSDCLIWLKRHFGEVLLAKTPTEGWILLQMNESTLELLIIHREGLKPHDSTGLSLVKNISNDPKTRRIPIIMTSEQLSPEQMAASQTFDGPVLPYPFDIQSLCHKVSLVMGISLATPPPFRKLSVQEENAKPNVIHTLLEMKLEEMAELKTLLDGANRENQFLKNSVQSHLHKIALLENERKAFLEIIGQMRKPKPRTKAKSKSKPKGNTLQSKEPSVS